MSPMHTGVNTMTMPQIFDKIVEFIQTIARRGQDLTVASVIEIVVLSVIIYFILRWIKNTRAWALLKAVAVIAIFWVIAYAMHMNTILWIATRIFPYVVIGVIIALQPEFRKGLEDIGNKNILSGIVRPKTEEEAFSLHTVEEIASACTVMSKARTGALIVIQCKAVLGDFISTGIDIDAVVSGALLINIFEKNTPLHDGAVIIRGNRICAATCYLPLSDNMDIDKNLGTRHRAGLGISELTDSLTVIVSEETGHISVAERGTLYENVDPVALRNRLKRALPDTQPQDPDLKKLPLRRRKRAESAQESNARPEGRQDVS